MQAYSGALDKKVLFASMNVALECIADMGTSYIMSDGIVMSSINNYNASGNMEIYYYFPEQFVSIMLFYFLIIIVKNIYRTKEYDDMSYNWLLFYASCGYEHRCVVYNCKRTDINAGRG